MSSLHAARDLNISFVVTVLRDSVEFSVLGRAWVRVFLWCRISCVVLHKQLLNCCYYIFRPVTRICFLWNILYYLLHMKGCIIHCRQKPCRSACLGLLSFYISVVLLHFGLLSLCVYAVLGLISSVLCSVIDSEDHIRNDPFLLIVTLVGVLCCTQHSYLVGSFIKSPSPVYLKRPSSATVAGLLCGIVTSCDVWPFYLVSDRDNGHSIRAVS